MNAYTATARGLAGALTGKHLAAQTVHICRTFGSEMAPRYHVLVIPQGEQFGRYWECGRLCLAALMAGETPEDLDLEELGPDEPEPMDAFDLEWDRKASRADRDNDRKWEGV